MYVPSRNIQIFWTEVNITDFVCWPNNSYIIDFIPDTILPNDHEFVPIDDSPASAEQKKIKQPSELSF